MAKPLLVIGNKNYSSWSLRPWIAMKVLGFEFEERRIALYVPGAKEEILRYSPSGKVPCLVDGELRVWDSLAILETLAESRGELWPAVAATRALARSICAEMHSGFAALRQHLSMNVRKRYPGRGRTPEALADIGRIVAIWSECRAAALRSGAAGPFLFGGFTAADAMFAPVVLRFRTYEVELPELCRAYADAVLALPAMQEWIAGAERETESIAKFDQYEPGP
jgi:glutathione S-transferase